MGRPGILFEIPVSSVGRAGLFLNRWIRLPVAAKRSLDQPTRATSGGTSSASGVGRRVAYSVLPRPQVDEGDQEAHLLGLAAHTSSRSASPIRTSPDPRATIRASLADRLRVRDAR
jgi:hypothetical protein